MESLSATSPAALQRPRPLERMRDHWRARHCSVHTETAQRGWVRRFILHHGKRKPQQGGARGIASPLDTR